MYEVGADGSLIIVSATLTDSGVYTCAAANRYGEANASAQLRVLSESIPVH